MSGRSVFLLSVLVAGVAAADPTGHVFAPAADDAFVLNTAPDTTHPDWDLRSGADAQGVYRTFARFPLPRSGEIVSATLKLGYAQSGSLGPSGQILDFVPDDAWSQEAISWNNQPNVTERIGTILESSNAGPISVDVTEFVRREQSLDGFLSLRIAGATEAPSSGGATTWPSREGRGLGFHLDLAVTPAPELRRGDIVMLATDGLFHGVVAIDPDERVLRGVAPIRFVGPIAGFGVDPRDGNLIATDLSGVVRIDRLTGNPVSLAEFGPRWEAPRALAVSPDGYVYTADELAGVIRIDPHSGTREVVSPGDGNCFPTGMALDGDSLLYGDWCGGLIRIDLGTGVPSVVPHVGRLYEPEGIAVEADGSVLVSDRSEDYGWSGRILRIDPASGTQTVLTELAFAPGAIALDPTGTIWVASRATGSLFMGAFGWIDPQLGTYTELFLDWEDPSGIAIDGDGAPLVGFTRGYNDAYIDRFDPDTGSRETIAAPLGPPWWYALSATPEEARSTLFIDADRNFLVVTDDRVVRVDPATGAQSLIARIESAGCAPNPICLTSDAALAPDGRIVLLREAHPNPRLVFIDPIGGDVTVQTLVWPLSWTDRLAIESGGTILLNHHYFSDAAIARYDPLTGQSSAAFDLSALVPGIGDMALDAGGTLFVADTAGNAIVRVDPMDGSIALVDSSPAPGRIIVDARGRIFSWGALPADRLLSFDPSTGSRALLATTAELQANRTFAVLEPACANHLDDDGDGFVDLADPGCANAGSPRENPQCDNGRDDDGDGTIDLDDPNCTSSSAAERSCGLGVELALALAALSRLRARVRPPRS